MAAFTIKFLLFCGISYTLVNYLPPTAFIGPMNTYTASLTGILLSALGVDAAVRGVNITTAGFSVKIITECSAIFVIILFSGFVLAYPSDLRHKALGLALGIPSLFVFNLTRLAFIVIVGMHSRFWFEIAHVYIGQIVMILMVLIVCMIWLRETAESPPKDSMPLFAARFAAASCALFILWLFLDEAFVRVNLLAIGWVLSLFGMAATVPVELKRYPDTFNTFHFVAFSALMLASRHTGWRRKARQIGIGLGVLVAAYFIFGLIKVLYLEFHFRYAFGPLVALIILNQWILPFGLWLFFVRDELFKEMRSGTVCPICGEEKAGIIDHIRAKHGEGALKDRRVVAILGGGVDGGRG